MRITMPKLLCLVVCGVLVFSLGGANKAFAAVLKDLDDGGVPKDWYLRPDSDEILYSNKFKKPWSKISEKFSRSVEDLIKAQGDSFDRFSERYLQNSLNSSWDLNQIRTDFGISSGGKMGILALQGALAVESRWFKKDGNYNDSDALIFAGEQENEHSFSINSDISEPELNRQLVQVVNLVYGLGKISNRLKLFQGLKKRLQQVRQLLVQLGPLPHSYWQPSRFRMELFVDADANVGSVLNMGADLRLRFDWFVITKTYYKNDKVKPVSKSRFSQLVKSLAQDLDHLVNEQKPIGDVYKPVNVAIVLGLNAQGYVGIAHLRANTLGWLWFAKPQNPRVTPAGSLEASSSVGIGSLPLIAELPNSQEQRFISKFNIKMLPTMLEGRKVATYDMSRARFRSGLKKARKIAAFFGKRAQAVKFRHWSLDLFRTDFDLSVGGSLGLATLSSIVSVRIMFGRQDRGAAS